MTLQLRRPDPAAARRRPTLAPPEGTAWQAVTKMGFEDIEYDRAEGIARISIARPEVHNAYRPETLCELSHALADAAGDPEVGAIILTGKGGYAFCSGGDQRVRGEASFVSPDGVARVGVLELQRQIRALPKPVIAMVAGYAIGGGHLLHVVCDLTLAADNAIFGQTGPRVGSFDGGFGARHLSRMVGKKKAREIWFLCRQYDAYQALEMGMVNAVVPLADLERETVSWCREILAHSHTTVRCLKAAMNADTDEQAGLRELPESA